MRTRDKLRKKNNRPPKASERVKLNAEMTKLRKEQKGRPHRTRNEKGEREEICGHTERRKCPICDGQMRVVHDNEDNTWGRCLTQDCIEWDDRSE